MHVTMLRRILDSIYLAGAFAGAASIVAIGLLITSQVIGRELGIQVKGADDLTAWSVVAAGFLPMAYTYRCGGHIRVTVLIERFAGASRKAMEIVVLAVATFLVGYMTYSAFDMVWDSFRFEELSQNLIVIPIWIPQMSIAVGSLLFTIAMLDDLVAALLGGMPSYVSPGNTAGTTDREPS